MSSVFRYRRLSRREILGQMGLAAAIPLIARGQNGPVSPPTHRLFSNCKVDGVACGPDGVRCDVHGNVWASSNAGRAVGYSGVTVREPCR